MLWDASWTNQTGDTPLNPYGKNYASAAPSWQVAAVSSPKNVCAAGIKDILTLLYTRGCLLGDLVSLCRIIPSVFSVNTYKNHF